MKRTEKNKNYNNKPLNYEIFSIDCCFRNAWRCTIYLHSGLLNQKYVSEDLIKVIEKIIVWFRNSSI